MRNAFIILFFNFGICMDIESFSCDSFHLVDACFLLSTKIMNYFLFFRQPKVIMLSHNWEWCNKIIYNITIYKKLKWTELTTLKLPLSNLNNYLAYYYRVGGSEFVKMQLLSRVFGLWRGRLFWTIPITWRGLKSVWRALSYFFENCSVTA